MMWNYGFGGFSWLWQSSGYLQPCRGRSAAIHCGSPFGRTPAGPHILPQFSRLIRSQGLPPIRRCSPWGFLHSSRAAGKCTMARTGRFRSSLAWEDTLSTRYSTTTVSTRYTAINTRQGWRRWRRGSSRDDSGVHGKKEGDRCSSCSGTALCRSDACCSRSGALTIPVKQRCFRLSP